MEGKEVAEGVGFLKKLFDFSFTSFITLNIVKLLFGIAIVICIFSTVGMIATAFQSGTFSGVLVLILSPILFLIQVICARVWLELVIVLFRIAEDVHSICEGKREQGAPS